jgi:hypothetical protein
MCALNSPNVFSHDKVERNITWSEEGMKYRKYNESMKANGIGHVLCRNCLIKHAIEGKMEG